jgi:fucose permease
MSTIPNTIAELLSKKQKAGTRLELSDACYALAQALATFATSFFCIDVLDECGDNDRWYLINLSSS